MKPASTRRRDIREASAEEAIIEGLTSLRDAARAGEPIEARFTMRTVELVLEPREFTPEDIRALRERLEMSQSVFARLLGARPKTVQSWEQGRTPPPMARRLLEVIDADVKRWRDRLVETSRSAPSRDRRGRPSKRQVPKRLRSPK
jgi:putative transcriptional regulator